MNYEIIDNFLSDPEFNQISNVMLGTDFPWFMQKGIAYHQSEADYPGTLFTHIFFINNQPNSQLIGLLEPLIREISPKALIRVKANLYPALENYYVHEPHVDHEFPHKGAIFFLNTNNGHTILEDGTKINSVSNRMVYLDTSKPHQSTNCTDQKFRANINFNFF